MHVWVMAKIPAHFVLSLFAQLDKKAVSQKITSFCFAFTFNFEKITRL